MRDTFSIKVNRLRAKLVAKDGFRVEGGQGGPTVVCPQCLGVIFEAQPGWFVEASTCCARCLRGDAA